MTYYKFIALIVILFCLVGYKQAETVKKVNLYQNKITIEVPVSWQVKNNYRRYGDYQIKYSAEMSDKMRMSILTVDIYDSSRMYNTPITVELLDDFKGAQLNSKGKSVKFLESKVIRISDHEVGILTYTFNNANNKLCFGTQLFFRTSADDFYEIEIYSLSKPVVKFKETIKKIIKSIQFN